MAWKEVKKYHVAWQHTNHRGFISLIYAGQGGKQINNLPYEDFTAMVDLMRNESPIYYDENQSLLATQHEPVGEEETG
jgi:hypothetical protein